MDRETLAELLIEVDTLSRNLNLPSYTLYILGGSSCILNGYIQRGTMDIDILDIEYPSSFGRLTRLLGEVDTLDWHLTTLSPDFADRATRLDWLSHLQVYTLSVEDIITSKLGRYSSKDKEDISYLGDYCNLELLFKLCESIINRVDLSPVIRERFIENYNRFRSDFNV